MKKLLILIPLLIGLLAGCANNPMTQQDRDDLITIAVLELVDNQKTADHIMKAVYVIERAVDPEFPAVSTNHLLISFNDWVDGEDWEPQRKIAAKLIVRRSLPQYDYTLPIDDDRRGQILSAMQSIRDALTIAGYSIN